MIRKLVCAALILGALLGGRHGAVRAQGPDAWTNIDLNMRAGPGAEYDVVVILPPETPLIIEAHDGALTWLLARTEDGSRRGWVASGFLRYREGFYAGNLPASSEIVPADAASAPAAPAPAAPAADAPADSGPPADVSTGGTADGAIESMRLVYTSPNAEYYRITYWSDGLRINGFLGWPKSDGPHPAVIYNRGGAWDGGMLIGLEIVPLVEAGYVAAASQYRGCGGSEGLDTFGWDDVHDVLNLIPLLQALPKVDPWRIGMMGGSRGGMMTYLALKEETLRGEHWIRAAVTVGGIADLFLWADENIDQASEIYMAVIGSMPSQNPEPYIHRSAVRWPELINAPLLLLHGESDTTVPPEQGYRLQEALRNAGKDVTLIVYPGDDHPLTGQLGGYPEALRFFERYLGGDGVNRQYDTYRDAIHETSAWFWENRP